MKPQLKLKEIIWEITGECHNNCAYCGSKSVKNSWPRPETIYTIAERICAYPPEEINISGGDPLSIPFVDHEHITKLFWEHGIKPKIIVNPLSFLKYGTWANILNRYDWIGVSINTQEELDIYIKYRDMARAIFEKSTIITNFNLKNIFLFDSIAEIIPYQHCWQIQYTMGNYFPMHDDKMAVKYLQDKINEWTQRLPKDASIVLADNMNCGQCTAGMKSVGILCNGDVVPCLSMRSYEPNIPIAGNLIRDNLRWIWEEGFSSFRCREFTCCKDICKNTLSVPPKVTEKDKKEDIIRPFYGVQPPTEPYVLEPYNPIKNPIRNPWGEIQLYGVTEPTYVYAVTEPVVEKPMIMAYAVFTYETTSTAHKPRKKK